MHFFFKISREVHNKRYSFIHCCTHYPVAVGTFRFQMNTIFSVFKQISKG